MAKWNQEKAMLVLRNAREAAQGRGLSDRALGRMAALFDDDAVLSRRAFQDALRRAGWGKRRIRRALEDVDDKPSQAMVAASPLAPLMRAPSFAEMMVLYLDRVIHADGGLWMLVGALVVGASGSLPLVAYALLVVGTSAGAARIRQRRLLALARSGR